MIEQLKSPPPANKLKYYLLFAQVSVRNALQSILHIAGPNFLFLFSSKAQDIKKKPGGTLDMASQLVQHVQHSFPALCHKAPLVHWTVRLRRLEYRRTGQKQREENKEEREKKRKRG